MTKIFSTAIIIFLFFLNISAQSSIDELMKENEIILLKRRLILESYYNNNWRCIEIYDSLIILEPNIAENYFKKGVYYKALDSLDIFESYCDTALSMGLDSMRVYKTKYYAYNYRNDYDKAMFYAKEIVRMEPTNGDLYLNVAGVYSSMGNHKMYYYYFKKAYDNNGRQAKALVENEKSNGTWKGFKVE